MKRYLSILFILFTTISMHSWGQVTVEVSTDSVKHQSKQIINIKIKNISKDLTYGFWGDLALLGKNRVNVIENYSDNSKKYLTDELFPNILLYFLKPNEVYTSNVVVYNQLPSKFAVKVGLYYMAYRFPKRINTKHIKPKDLNKYQLKEISELNYFHELQTN